MNEKTDIERVVEIKDNGQYFISCLSYFGKYEPFSVPFAVFMYVKQLENFIADPEESNLKEIYSDRFNKNEPDKSYLIETEVKHACINFIRAYFKNDQSKIDEWFNTPNPLLGGVSPTHMIDRGREKKLWQFITQRMP
jgi:hypothetical protein